MTLLAYCKNAHGNLVKRIPMTNPVQTDLEAVFLEQEAAFRRGRPNEVAFDGGWTPDEDELLTLAVSPEVDALVNAASGNALALPVINTGNFDAENIKALFTMAGGNGAARLLVQRFTGVQMLNRKRSLLLDGNTFRNLSEPAFAIGSSLACIVENGLIKFDKYHNLRAIFDVSEFYAEATDEDIDTFAGHASLAIADVAALKLLVTQTERKLIHKLASTGVLDAHTPEHIRHVAGNTGLAVQIDNGRIVFPTDKAEIRRFLRFLDDSLYTAPLSGQRYVTNSKRAV